MRIIAPFFVRMKQTRLSELFPYENVINNKSLETKVCVWNNRTMLYAEENSDLFYGKLKSFEEILGDVLKGKENAVQTMLFASMINTLDGISIEEFVKHYEKSNYQECYQIVLDGLLHYLPDDELNIEINEIEDMMQTNQEEGYSDRWAFLFYFCKKHFGMSDEEFLNSTWRTISILQKELLKDTPNYQNQKVVGAENIDI